MGLGIVLRKANRVGQPGHLERMYVLLVMLIVTLLAVPAACSRPVKQLEPVTVGMEATAVNTLIYLAQDQRYFAEQGLNVEIRDNYASGAAAAEDMVQGRLDFATTAELAIVRQALAGGDVRALATIDTFIHMNLMARPDLGIRSLPDIVGKKVGVPLKTAADFMFSRFLEINRIRPGQLTVVDVQAPQAVDALVNGEVAAVVAWQPNAITLQKRLGTNLISWSIQNGQPLYCVVVTSSATLSARPALADKFLAALVQAEKYAVRNPNQTREFIRKRLSYDEEYINTIWTEHNFSVALSQSLVAAMEDQARWVMASQAGVADRTPDFLDYIHAESLTRISPDAVNIIQR